jgi:hypothetical protein
MSATVRQNTPFKSTSNPLDGGNLDVVRKLDSLTGTKLINKDELDSIISVLKSIE